MNKGLDLAAGDVIGFLNSDDFYFNKFSLEKLANEFSGNESSDIVYGDLQYVEAENTTKVVRKWISGNSKRCFF